MRYQLRMSSFRKWLESKRKTQIVGYRAKCHDCPIAWYIREKYGIMPYVNKSEWGVSMLTSHGLKGVHKQNNPGWAIDFIMDLDGSPTIKKAVTAKAALRILDQLD